MSPTHDELATLQNRVAELEAALAVAHRDEPGQASLSGEHAIYSHPIVDRSCRAMIEQMREGALTVPGGLDDTILYCNRAFADMVGMPPTQVIGRRLTAFMVPGSRPGLARLLGEAGNHRLDLEFVCPRGGAMPVSISSSHVEIGGDSSRCLVITDLTDRKDVERLREAQRALELAARRKDEFIAMLGHELRNPLAPLRQVAEVLELRGGEPLRPPESGQVQRVLIRQVGHLRRLVDDLLDAGRITRGTLRLRREAAAIQDVVDTAVESVERLIVRRHHALEIRVPAEPLYCLVDPVRVTQVLSNLLSNAAKFTPDGGRVLLEAEADGSEVVIEISDSGRGIRSELLPHIFEPFVQDDATLDRGEGGLGVGLALVAQIVELHGGSVAASSPGPGQGATFSLRFPRGQSRIAVPPATRCSDTAQQTVLICDDNADAAEMLSLVLSRQGHEVHVAHDGEDAIDLARRVTPSVAFIDIGLPGIDGYEVACRIRGEATLASVRLVALTGYGQAEDLRRSRDAGFDHHLVKPASPEDIEALLESGARA